MTFILVVVTICSFLGLDFIVQRLQEKQKLIDGQDIGMRFDKDLGILVADGGKKVDDDKGKNKR